MSLWAEIKQRRMTQVVITYLAGGWMVLEGFDQLVDREILPLVFYEVVLTLFLFGFLIALVVGWYHGEKGAQKATPFELTLVTVISLAGLISAGMVVQRSMRAETLAEAGLDLKNIAVLYFEDLSPDGSNQAVADGITEGLISTLSQVRDLDVSSRNAAREVRELGIDADSAAALLNAGVVVEGTLEQRGDGYEVSVRILEGASGTPLSRATIPWPADEVASVSGELATEVANALRSALGEEIRLRTGREEAPTGAAWLRVARAERAMKDAQSAIQRGDGAAVAAAFDEAEAELGQVLDLAEESDWAEPFVLRGQVAYERYILAGTVEAFIGTLTEAVDFAEQALDIEPNSAAAMELRGTAKYRRWLLQAEDEATLDRLFESAQADLEEATILDPTRASAFSTLSHLYYQVSEWDETVLAARRAYTEDAFLAAADGVLWRLYAASYDLGRRDDAQEWCSEGRERFPQSFRFFQCQIFLMTMPGAERDVASAWALLDSLRELAPPGQEEYLIALSKLAVGAVLGLEAMPDSADAVLTDARVGGDVDPEGELQSIEAAMRSVMGDVDGSIQVLRRFMSGHPDHFPGEHWWWRNVQGDPAFERLRAGS